MSSTRYARDGAPIAQNRYASAPEYATLRGINGTAVCAKARLLNDPRKARLLYFIQGLSIQPGGLAKFVDLFLDMFPERIATRLMVKHGIKCGKKVEAQTARAISAEIQGNAWSLRRLAEDALLANLEADSGRNVCKESPRELACMDGEEIINNCRAEAQRRLPDFLTELSINPQIEISLSEDCEAGRAVYRHNATEQGMDVRDCDFRNGAAPWFIDIIPALFEFQKRYAEAQMEGLAMTEPARRMLAAVEKTNRSNKIQIIEGLQGCGKTKFFEAWCSAHLGQARLVKLIAPMNKTVFFRLVSQALGLASGYMRKTTDMQAHVQEFLHSSRMVLVLDEAHQLISASQRVNTQPELLDWCYTALTNYGVPVVLSTTSSFPDRISHITKRIPWNFEQIESRSDRTMLEKPTVDDVEAVGWKLFPKAEKRAMRALAIYFANEKTPLRSLAYCVDELRQSRPGEPLTFKLLQAAVWGRADAKQTQRPQSQSRREAQQDRTRFEFEPANAD